MLIKTVSTVLIYLLKSLFHQVNKFRVSIYLFNEILH